MQHAYLHKTIADCLKINYGINVSNITLLPIGADIDSTIYIVEAQNHLRYFVKLKYGSNTDKSAAIFELLHKAKIHNIIFPVTTLNNQFIQYMDNFTLIVYPFIEGENGFNRSLTEEQWLMLGKTLRHIHEIDVPASMQKRLRREAYSPKWRKLVRSIYNDNIAIAIEEDDIALKIANFMKVNLKMINRLVDYAEELSQSLKNAPTEFVLCHSDIHGGNVLVDSNEVIYIVDWDEPMMAPKERDLMFIGGGVGNVWNKPNEVAFFYKGYGTAEVSMQTLAYYRFERIVEDIAIYAQQLLLNTVETERRSELYQHFISMFEPNGVVDIAFATVER